MSISFIPTAGTWTGYSYMVVAPCDVSAHDDVQHGVLRTQDIEPSVDCHMSGAYWLLDQLKLGRESCGEVAADQIRQLLDATLELYRYWCRDLDASESYEARKLQAMLAMLRHCLYHNCGFAWA